jgi:hypothetical protein
VLSGSLTAWAYVDSVGLILYAPVVIVLCGICLSRNLGYSCCCNCLCTIQLL